jgi:hypothetical protein
MWGADSGAGAPGLKQPPGSAPFDVSDNSGDFISASSAMQQPSWTTQGIGRSGCGGSSNGSCDSLSGHIGNGMAASSFSHSSVSGGCAAPTPLLNPSCVRIKK